MFPASWSTSRLIPRVGEPARTWDCSDARRKTDFLRTFRPRSPRCSIGIGWDAESPARPVLLGFAGKFWGAIEEDGALVPGTLSASTRLGASGCLGDDCGEFRRGCLPAAKIADQFLEFPVVQFGLRAQDCLRWASSPGQRRQATGSWPRVGCIRNCHF
jgi:hypothetical protein